MNNHATLLVELGQLPVEVHSIEELPARWMRRRDPCQLRLELHPHSHRVDPDRLSVEAGDEQLQAVLALDQSAKRVRDLETTFIVNLCRKVSPKHACSSTLFHKSPPIL